MKLITIDFETYYDKVVFSLSKMTTEEYVRDDRFQVIGVAIKVDDKETEWASGTHEQIKAWLQTFPWKDSMLLAHNCMFDGQRKGIPTLSVLGSLNNDYEGGEFLMFDEEKEYKIKAGEIMIFPSVFLYPHRVAPVTKGTRDTFVSWVW